MLLHLMTVGEWVAWRADEPYSPPSLATEGFVHCTGDDTTLLAVANRFYASVADDMVVVGLDPDALGAEVRWEAPAHPDGSPAAPDARRFPHVYGPLVRHAVREVRPVERDAAGGFLGFGAPLPR